MDVNQKLENVSYERHCVILIIVQFSELVPEMAKEVSFSSLLIQSYASDTHLVSFRTR